MIFEMLFTWKHHFHGLQEESSFLESADDFSDQTSLNSVRLNHDEGVFHLLKDINNIVNFNTDYIYLMI